MHMSLFLFLVSFTRIKARSIAEHPLSTYDAALLICWICFCTKKASRPPRLPCEDPSAPPPPLPSPPPRTARSNFPANASPLAASPPPPASLPAALYTPIPLNLPTNAFPLAAGRPPLPPPLLRRHASSRPCTSPAPSEIFPDKKIDTLELGQVLRPSIQKRNSAIDRCPDRCSDRCSGLAITPTPARQ